MRLERVRDHDPLLDVAAAFALGAAFTWVAAALLQPRRRAVALTDETLRERVRERVAALVSRPEAIDVTVEDGVVRLAGQLQHDERDVLLSELVGMPGVSRLRSALSSTAEAAS